MKKDNEMTQYSDFVYQLTSNPSKDHDLYIARLNELKDQGLNVCLFDTGSSGLCSEGGELMEISKKMKFQGKDFNEDVRFHLKRELGDILFYWMDAVRALGYEPLDIIDENVLKLQHRYPGGEFSIQRSEHRDENDL